MASTNYAKFSGIAGGGSGGSGTVTSVSVVSANGLAGTVANPTTTPAITLSTTITGVLQGNGTAISAAHVADATHDGYLSSTDWNTFNGKQASGNYITALTGDGTASGPGSAVLTFATVNSNTGSFGSSTAIPSFTVNGKGLITAASTNAVIAPAGTLTGTTLNSSVVTSSLTTVGTLTGGTWNATTIDVGHGGTGVTSVTTSPTASAFAGWDANSNLSANNSILGVTTTATAAGTTTLVVGSTYQQVFTGSTTQTVKLPVATTLSDGLGFLIVNQSTGAVTVQTSGLNTIWVMSASTQLQVTCINTAGGTGTASWAWNYGSSSATNMVAVGGTGLTTATAYAPICGGTTLTGPFQMASTGLSTSGAVLTSTGSSSLPTWQGLYAGLTTDGVIYATSATAIASTAAGTNKYPLVSQGGGGSAPQFAQLDLTAAVTGALPIANGGTANGSLAVTAGGTLYTDGTKVVNVGAGTTGQVLTSNGSSAPTWGPVRVYSAFIANNGTATISSQYPASWLASVTRNSAGNVSLTFTGGTFTNTPFAVAMISDAQTAGSIYAHSLGSWSNTSIVFQVLNLASTAADSGFYVICTGN